MCLRVLTVCGRGPWRPEAAIRTLGVGVTGGCETTQVLETETWVLEVGTSSYWLSRLCSPVCGSFLEPFFSQEYSLLFLIAGQWDMKSQGLIRPQAPCFLSPVLDQRRCLSSMSHSRL